MAKLFLSYSRRDESKARRLTTWLERESHDVWRDEDDIGGGASFSSEIEKALKNSDAVLVLWSTESVRSAWVRDEAAYGRDCGKLIPLSLDQTEPPLGFRQFQTISLSGWRGHREPPHADRIRSAIARITSLPESAPETRRRSPKRLFPPLLLIAGLMVLVAAAVVAVFLWQRWSNDQQVAISVLPSAKSSDRAIAADYANVAAADMAAFLPRRFDRATVIAPADANEGTSGYHMLISTDPHGAAVNASLTLSDRDGRTILWSKNWSVADAAAADLKAEVSASASKAALCLTEARGGSRRLSQPALGLYLSGCIDLAQSNLSDTDFEAIFERITKLAPDFGPGWDYLALSRSWIAEGLRDGSSPAYPAALKSAREAIAAARKINPGSAKSYDAEYHLISNDRFLALQVLEKGAKMDPDYGEIQMHLADAFQTVGRMTDAVQAAKRGVELEPGSPFARSQYIGALVYSGAFAKAKAEIAKARQKWPNDPSIDFAEFGFQFRYGDPRLALELLPRITDSSDAQTAPLRKLIAARLDRAPAKIDDAIASITTARSNEPAARNKVLLALGNFGRIDQVYQLLQDPQFQHIVATDILFRPDFAGVRADPRFMQVAARLGLVRYWRQTGDWPDFCSSERLRYDCKAEAARYPK